MPTSYKDIQARLKLWGRGYKDTGARFRVDSGKFKDSQARFSLLVSLPAAILTAPLNNSLLRFDQAQLFDWTYYEPLRPTATQDGYALRRRRLSDNRQEWWDAATSTWGSTELFNTSSTESVSIGASKWSDYSQTLYAWTVRVRGSGLLLNGPYATELGVQFTNLVTPVITGPASITAATATVTWTAAEQTAFRVRLLKGAEVLHDSGQVFSLSTRSYVVGVMANGDNVDMEVRVWNSDGVEGPVATSNKTVSYTAPSIPTLIGSNPAGIPRNRIAITNPGGGDTVVSNEVWRSPSGVAGTFTRIATGIAVNGTYDDYSAPIGIASYYFVRAIGTSNTIRDSAVL